MFFFLFPKKREGVGGVKALIESKGFWQNLMMESKRHYLLYPILYNLSWVWSQCLAFIQMHRMEEWLLLVLLLVVIIMLFTFRFKLKLFGIIKKKKKSCSLNYIKSLLGFHKCNKTFFFNRNNITFSIICIYIFFFLFTYTHAYTILLKTKTL